VQIVPSKDFWFPSIYSADLDIVAQQHKVCVQTERTVYTDAFFEEQDLVVNALDNVEARRYVDRYALFAHANCNCKIVKTKLGR